MKKLIIIVAVAFGGSALGYFIVKSSGEYSAEIFVNIDKTDTFLTTPDKRNLFASVKIDENKWASFKFRLNTITDFDFNESYAFTLPQRMMLFSSPIKRDSAIAKLKHDVSSRLDSLALAPVGRKKATVYSPMIRNLDQLARSKADDKRDIYYSDLHENTQSFSSYNKKDVTRLFEHPEEVRKLFYKLEAPGNYHGIKVYFIFRPKNDKENSSFLVMSTFFKKILEDAGAKVFVGATLPENDNW